MIYINPIQIFLQPRGTKIGLVGGQLRFDISHFILIQPFPFQVAVKRVLPEKLISQPSSFLQEAAIMVRMQHENVIRLFGVVLDTKAVMLVSELASCGSLLECLQNTSNAHREPAFSISTICDFALQIGRGMRYLSSQRLIHRDLAARNVLVCSPTKVAL
jgi:activated CDC42 kinase 1